uniref:Uncharacterized protein n=1 Tax=Glossina palpalis gambiensis TaxID=67801 RepID=A0A1B0B9R2_9MUSC
SGPLVSFSDVIAVDILTLPSNWKTTTGETTSNSSCEYVRNFIRCHFETKPTTTLTPSHLEVISNKILQVWNATWMRPDIESRPKACKLVHNASELRRFDKM